MEPATTPQVYHWIVRKLDDSGSRGTLLTLELDTGRVAARPDGSIDLAPIEAILAPLIEAEYSVITRAIESSLRDQGLTVSEVASSDISGALSINLETGETVQRMHLEPELISDPHRILAADIMTKILAAVEKQEAAGLETVRELIAAGKFKEAASAAREPLTNTKGNARPLQSEFRKIERRDLPDSDRASVLDAIIALSTITHDFADVAKEIEERQKLPASATRLRNLWLLKARGENQLRHREKARVLYEKLLNDKDCEPVFRAWALQGLAEVSTRGSDDAILFHERAGDAFLEAGQRRQATTNYLAVARALRHEDPDRAFALVDRVLALFGDDEPDTIEARASIFHSRAELLHVRGRLEEALDAVEHAVRLRRLLTGNEGAKTASLHLAGQVARDLGRIEKADEYERHADEISQSFRGELALHYRIEQACLSGDSDVLRQLRDEAVEASNERLAAMCEVCLAVASPVAYEDRIALAEGARTRMQELELDDRDLALVEMTFAELYRQHGDKEKAMRSYVRVHELTPENHMAARLAMRLLAEHNRWGDVAIVARTQLRLHGERADLLATLGQALLESGRPKEAIPPLVGARSYVGPKDQSKLDALLVRAAVTQEEAPIESTVAPRRVTTLRDFELNLSDFQQHVQADRRMTFWVRGEGPGITHDWVKKPETHAKTMIWSFLVGRFPTIEILEEVPAGNSRIDLYIRLEGGERIVLELKMLGNGYSSSYAEEGFEQLCTYMDSRKSKVGYLIAFDARIRDQGKALRRLPVNEERSISVLMVDVRPT